MPAPSSSSPDHAAGDGLTAHTFAAGLVGVAVLGALLRVTFATADPPWLATVGIVWHDEGAWVHNARNRALFGQWQLDAWNPLFIAPVFTWLEYLSFSVFGVGVWQARLVSELLGWLSVVALGLGVARLGGRSAGLGAAGLLATNYVYVMYNRAALMEASMVAFMVLAWTAFVRAQERPAWGMVAGLLAVLAFFSKAAAVFYLVALGLVALHAVLASGDEPTQGRWRWPDRKALSSPQRAALWTLVGLAGATALSLVVFVGPNWNEYQFYNWQMSVTRKPTYDLQSFLNRTSWLPIVHDFFTRMWFITLVSLTVLLRGLTRWRRTAAPERLLHAWILVGTAELILHDTGNERRFVFLIPAMAALASLAILRDRRLFDETDAFARRSLVLASPAVLYALYVAWGPLARLPFLYEVRPAVRIAAAFAVASAIALYTWWPHVSRWITTERWLARPAWVLVALVMGGDLAQYGQWVAGRSYKNYEASVELGRRLPPGTLVHGKLANGLALENQIRPVFIGRDFGNYRDRFERNDIRYVLTYTHPRLGYEGPVIREVIAAYPERRVLWTFDVRETTSGLDAAVLLEKGPPGPRPVPTTPIARAQD